ncbi:hypothetical protein ABW19_dt0203929 [Dactylella cylindrospora]|nr:hypothetical protein ABW19_dt0203929 [Dactylella cylindrospora]
MGRGKRSTKRKKKHRRKPLPKGSPAPSCSDSDKTIQNEPLSRPENGDQGKCNESAPEPPVSIDPPGLQPAPPPPARLPQKVVPKSFGPVTLGVKTPQPQHKKDIIEITTWLVTTAMELGHDGNTPGMKLKPNWGRESWVTEMLKSEAEIAAQVIGVGFIEGSEDQERLETFLPDPPRYTGQEYQLSITGLEELADYISRHEKRLLPPSRVLEALARNLSFRKEQSQKKQKLFKDPGVQKRDSVFIEALEKVRSLLKKKRAEWVSDQGLTSSKVDQATEKERAHQAASLPAQYEALSIDATPSEIQGNSEASLSTDPNNTPSSSKPINTANLEYGYAEGLDDVADLLCEINEIRKFLKHLWDEYKADSLQIEVVSLVTSLAIRFVRELEENLNVEFERNGFYNMKSGIMQNRVLGPCPELAFSIFVLGTPVSQKKNSKETITRISRALQDREKSTDCLYRAFIISQVISEVLARHDGRPKEDLEQRSGASGVDYRQVLELSYKVIKEDIEAVCGVLPLLFESACVYSGDSLRSPGEDDFITALRWIRFGPNSVKLWTLFAIQLYLDTRQVVGDELGRPCTRLVDYCDFLGKVALDVRVALSKSGVYDQGDPGDRLFFRRLECFDFKSLSLKISASYEDTFPFIRSIARLYLAARSDGLLEAKWDDMELFLKIFDRKWFFSSSCEGPHSKSRSGRWNASCGNQLSDYTKPDWKFDPEKCSGIQGFNKLQVATFLCGGVCALPPGFRDCDDAEYSAEQINEVVASHYPSLRYMSPLEEDAEVASSTTIRDKDTSKSSQTTASTTNQQEGVGAQTPIIEKLRKITAAARREFPMLDFEISVFHKICDQIIHCIFKELELVFRMTDPIGKQNGVTSRNNHALMAWHILRNADRYKKNRGVEGKRPPSGVDMLQEVANVIKKFIDDGLGDVVKRVMEDPGKQEYEKAGKLVEKLSIDTYIQIIEAKAGKK